jgi:hypothetical protein
MYEEKVYIKRKSLHRENIVHKMNLVYVLFDGIYYCHKILPKALVPYPKSLQALHLSTINFLSHENTGSALV